jgi:lycopene cyclase domain-containing protein
MSLYLKILLVSIAVPLALSFDKRVRFYLHWRAMFISIPLVAALYITADIFFVKHGIWGFNPQYHSGNSIAGLPLEEWLFFVIIPYCCVFIHYVLNYYFPDIYLRGYILKIFSFFLIALLLVLMMMNLHRSYSMFMFALVVVSLVLALLDKSDTLGRYYFSFIVILIPFFLINGILTGTFIEGSVFWYNESEILGKRILSVPVEDAGLTFSLILLNLLLMNRIQMFLDSGKKKITL